MYVFFFHFFFFFFFYLRMAPVVIPFVVAVFGIFRLLVILFGPRSPPHKCIANLSKMFKTCIVRALYTGILFAG